MGCVVSHPKSTVESPLKIQSNKDFALKSKGTSQTNFLLHFFSNSEKRRCRFLKFRYNKRKIRKNN